MRRLLALFGLLLSAACAATPALEPASPGYTVTVSRAEGGDWLAEYRFIRAAPAWLFPRSRPGEDGRPWRPQSWTVETPGVRLERRGRHDLLLGDGRPLTAVSIRVRPFTTGLRADYTPVLRFSDGAQAHFGGHYEVAPLASTAAAEGLPADLNGYAGLDYVAGRLILREPGRRLLLNGRVSRGEAAARLGGKASSAYVYSGNSPIVQTEALAAVFDPGLPAWLREELNTFTPRLLALYADELGPSDDGRPTVFAAWGGPAFQGVSLGGSVLNGLVVMDLSGTRLMTRSAPAVDRLHRFLGHEAAHFWLGQTVGYDRRNEAWITEGGANLLAVRALQRLGSPADARAELQSYLDGCLKQMTPGRSLREASEGGADDDGHYTCGALLWLAAEAAQKRRDPGADPFTFVSGLIEANRADGELTADEWLVAFERTTGDAALAAAVRGFIEQGVSDPHAFLADLLTRTGVPHARERDALRLL